MMRKVLLNEKGGLDVTLAMLFIVVIGFIMLVLFLDNLSVEHTDRHTRKVINDLNVDIYSLLDVEYTAFQTGFQITDSSEAYSMFLKGLKTRFNLDDSMNPKPGSPFSGKVTVTEFKIVSENEVPYSDGYGRTMMFPGVLVKLEAKETTPILGLSGNHTISVTTEIYR